MNAKTTDATHFVRPAVHDCWNRIGVRGDVSCSELKQHVHCRNCPVYSASARTLLDAPPPPRYFDFWTKHFARRSELAQETTHSVIIFRIGNEWLALPTSLCSEVADTRTIHSLPHRRDGAVLGIANVRGELLVTLSLTALLGLTMNAPSKLQRREAALQRLLVFHHGTTAVVFPIDEVHSIHRYSGSELTESPATVSKAQATYTKAILPWHDRAVAVLDEQLLCYKVDRTLA